ncbi:MAG: hypothetical protein NVS3B26_17720 [Mycobacteriales bacterium]
MTGPNVERETYYATRYTPEPGREQVWRHVTRFLARWIPADAAVLELGAGYCDFSNAVTARCRVAMDLSRAVLAAAAPGVTPEVGDCSDLSRFDDASFDCVFASNLLEHLDRPTGDRLLREALRVLRPGGRVILMQPNFRLRPGEYFDDYTHVTVYSDRSLVDVLAAHGFKVEVVLPRFLPQSMKSRFAGLSMLVPVYLRSPVKPLAGQMLVVARR